MEPTTRIHRTADSERATEQPTDVRPTVAGAAREHCSNCGSPLAPDQRYCIECGQRRGAPRFAFMEGVAQRSREIEAVPQRTRSRLNPNATLIAGIATLLLALGIGVLIGRTGNGSSGKTNPVQVLSIAGGGATGAAGASPTSGTSATTSTPASSAAAGAARAKATGTSTKGTFTTKAAPPKTTTLGGACKGQQQGCQNGHFTGNFFGQ